MTGHSALDAESIMRCYFHNWVLVDQIGNIYLTGLTRQKEVQCSCSSITKEPSIPLDQLLSASESMEIENLKYTLRAALAEDYQPSLPECAIKQGVGPCLDLGVHIEDVGSNIGAENQTYPAEKITHFWVINGSNNEIWEHEVDVFPDVRQHSRRAGVTVLSMLNGPDWTLAGDRYKGGPVTVVVKVLLPDGTEKLLKVSNIPIEGSI